MSDEQEIKAINGEFVLELEGRINALMEVCAELIALYPDRARITVPLQKFLSVVSEHNARLPGGDSYTLGVRTVVERLLDAADRAQGSQALFDADDQTPH